MKTTFNHIGSFRRGSAAFNLYRSARTGCDVLIINHTVPTVSACINFATKPFDDSGLPHTLEHLCFMGSHQYPFKGFLDSIANQTGASGTNGYTNEDHTSYTITNVGIQGFLKVLPVYLDHLLNPQLLKEHYTTEVHHIKEDGEDGGVVFSELQGYENDPDEMVDRSLRQYVYPDGNPFRYSAGGTVEGVRCSCNLEAVEQFHKDHYTLSNMSLVVMCPDTPDNAKSILTVLEAFEDHQDRFPASNATVFRPFRDVDVPVVYSDNHMKIFFPSTESTGVFFALWQGPEIMSDDCAGLEVCLTYLCSGPDSPLEKAFVQTGICSEISPLIRKNRRMEVGFRFGGVHHKYLKGYLTEKISFRDKLIETIKKAISKYDSDRMFYILKSTREEENYSLEGECVEHFNELFMLFRNFSSDGSEQDSKMLELLCSDRFLALNSYDIKVYFPELMQKYVSSNVVTFAAIPDRKAAEERDQNEEQLIQSRMKTLGSATLKEYQDTLDTAIASISANLPPTELIESFNVPSTITMPYEIARVVVDRMNVCYPIILHKIGCTEYVTVKIFFNITSIAPQYRPYLQLYIDTLTELDAVIDGKLVTCDELTSNRKRDFVDFNVKFGHGGTFRECLVFKFVLYPNENDFSKVAEWMDIFLKKLKYDEKRVKISCDRLSHEATERQLDAENILSDLMKYLTGHPDYSIRYQSVIAALNFHERTYTSSNLTTSMLKNLADEFQRTVAFQVHIAGAPESIEMVVQNGFSPFGFLFDTSAAHIEKSLAYNFNFEEFNSKTWVLTSDTFESSHLEQRSPCPYDRENPEFVHSMIFSQYLSMCEGPLWKRVRGEGLAYGVSTHVYPLGAVVLSINDSPNVMAAYKAVEECVGSIFDNPDISPVDFIAAKNSLLAEIIEDVNHPHSAATESVLDYLGDTGQDFHFVRFALDVIERATVEDVLKSAIPIFLNLFNEDRFIRGIVIPSKSREKLLKDYPDFQEHEVSDLGNCFPRNL